MPSRTLAAIVGDRVVLHLDAEQPPERRREMSAIAPRVKADEIRAEHSFHEPLAPREREEDLRIWKRDVEEEPDAQTRCALAQQRRHAHEVKVVNPDRVAGARARGDHVGVARVHRLVRLPSLDQVRQLLELIVKDRPEHAVGDVLVVDRHLFAGERNLHEPARRRAASGASVSLPATRCASSPLQPTHRLSQPSCTEPKPGCETAAARHHLDLVAASGDGDRESVGNDDQATHQRPRMPMSKH